MKEMKIITAVFLLFILTGNISAQNKTVSGVLKLRSSNLRPIYQGTEVKGYIALYFLDKEDKQNNTFVLQIFDENVNEVGQQKISIPKSQFFVASEYDGNNILLKFADTKAKIYDIRLFDEKGNLKKEIKIPVGKSQLYQLSAAMQSNTEDMMPDLFSIENFGFINYSIEDFKKTGFNINCINGDGIKWTYTSDKTSDKYYAAYYYQSNEDVLLSIVYRRDKLFTQDMDAFILGLDMKTGKKLFEIPTVTSKYEISPVGAHIESTDKMVIFGQYFPKGANIIKDKSLGFGVLEINSQGKINNEKYMTWEESVGKFEKVEGSKLKDGGYIYFHKTVKAANGNLILVGEQFRKAASAAGIVAMAMGGRSTGATKLIITDFMFLEFDKDYKMINAKRVEKHESDFAYPGIDYMGSMMASWLAKAMGAFDYEYTSFAADNSKFNVVYVDVDKLEDSKKKEAYCGSVAYQDGKFSVDKVPFTRDEKMTFVRVLPAKNGYFLVFKYFKKLKQFKLDLVKFNN